MKKSDHNFTAKAVVVSVFFSLLFFSHEAHASCVNATSVDTIALYHLEDLTDATGRYGDLTNTNASSGVAGHCNNAFEFWGSDLVVSTSTPTGVASMTIITSLKSDTDPSFNSYQIATKYIHQGASNGAEEYITTRDIAGTPYLYFSHNSGGGTAIDLSYPISIADGNWHNVIASYNDDTGKCFFQLDGITLASSTSCVLVGTWSDSLTIGSNQGQTLGWDGRIDEVVLKNTAMTEAEATAYYNDCWVGNDCGGSPPAPSVSASFAFPQNGSTTADFSNWVISLNGSPNSVGEVRIYYATNDGSAGFMDRVSVVGEIISPLAIHKRQPLVGNYTTSTWVAYIVVNDLSGATIYTSDVLQFHIGNVLPPFNSTTSLAMPFNPQAFQNTSTTYPSSTTALFGFQEGAFNFIQQQWIQFRSIFPFSIVFGFASTTEDAIRNASTSNANYDLYVNTTLLGLQVRFPILTSSTLEFVVGSTTKATIFDIERKFMWLGAGAFILFTIL